MSKLDLVKKYKSYYTAGRKPEIVKFEEASYLAVEGKGEPAGEMFVSKGYIKMKCGSILTNQKTMIISNSATIAKTMAKRNSFLDSTYPYKLSRAK